MSLKVWKKKWDGDKEENWNKIYAQIQAFFKNKKIGEFYFEVED